MTHPDFPGKQFLIETNRGYIYNDDKTKKTLSLQEAASWYGCNREDIVAVNSATYMFTGFRIEPSNEPNVVKISYYNVNHTRPTDQSPLSIIKVIDGEEDDENGYYFMNSDGQIRGEYDGSKTTYHKIRCLPRTVKFGWGADKYIDGIAAHMTDMNNNYIGYGCNAFSSYTKEVLKNAGFPERFKCSPTSSWETSLNNYDNLINYGKRTKGQTKLGVDMNNLPEFKPTKGIQVDHIKEGVLLRFVVGPHSYWDRPDTPGNTERGRVLISDKGTVSQFVLQNNTWIRLGSNASTSWFYSEIYKSGVDSDMFKDMFVTNPKLKYVNNWINKYLSTFYHTAKASNGSKIPSYYDAGIIEFCRIVNKYPVLVESMIKLGYGDPLFIQKRLYRDTKYDRITMQSKIENECVIDEYRNFNLLNIFGSLNKSTQLFEVLGINRAQWQYLTSHTMSNTPGDVCNNFHAIRQLKYYFCGETRNTWNTYTPEKPYKALKDVPMNEFVEAFDIWYKTTYTDFFGNHYSDNHLDFTKIQGYSRSNIMGYQDSILADFHPQSFSDRLRWDSRNNDAGLSFIKLVKECIKKNISYSLLTDYHRMRSDCKRNVPNFREEDWPVVPDNQQQVRLFHDRLVDISNNFRNLQRAEQEKQRNVQYATRLKELRKFNYEEPSDNRCIICPEDLMDIVSEGQRLHHCVGSYTSAVANGANTIMFLRDKNSKDQSYATIDMVKDPDTKVWKIRQAHTAYNGPISSEDVAFLKRWATVNNVDPDSIHEKYGALCHN